MEQFFEHGTSKQWWCNKRVGALNLNTPCTILPTVTCEDAVEIMKREMFDQLPVANEGGHVLGMVTSSDIVKKMKSNELTPQSPVSQTISEKFEKVSLNTSLAELSKIFEYHYFALVIQTQKLYSSLNLKSNRENVFAIATRLDLLEFITPAHPSPTVITKEFLTA